MTVVGNLQRIEQSIPEKVKLVVVTKTRTAEAIREIYHAGHRVFGENRVQELIAKQPALPPDAEWHLIGHLQSNKVKYIAPFISLIHSVDSLPLLQVIDKEAARNQRVIDCLLQVYIAKEETKFGMEIPELENLLGSPVTARLLNVRITGLMGMASFTGNMGQVREEFKYLNEIYLSIKQKYFKGRPYFKELSMGMSSDYAIAIEEGSTMVRIGSAIFG